MRPLISGIIAVVLCSSSSILAGSCQWGLHLATSLDQYGLSFTVSSDEKGNLSRIYDPLSEGPHSLLQYPWYQHLGTRILSTASWRDSTYKQRGFALVEDAHHRLLILGSDQRSFDISSRIDSDWIAAHMVSYKNGGLSIFYSALNSVWNLRLNPRGLSSQLVTRLSVFRTLKDIRFIRVVSNNPPQLLLVNNEGQVLLADEDTGKYIEALNVPENVEILDFQIEDFFGRRKYWILVKTNNANEILTRSKDELSWQKMPPLPSGKMPVAIAVQSRIYPSPPLFSAKVDEGYLSEPSGTSLHRRIALDSSGRPFFWYQGSWIP